MGVVLVQDAERQERRLGTARMTNNTWLISRSSQPETTRKRVASRFLVEIRRWQVQRTAWWIKEWYARFTTNSVNIETYATDDPV